MYGLQKQNNIPVNDDGVSDRSFELLLSDKTASMTKVTDIISDYINFVSIKRCFYRSHQQELGMQIKRRNLQTRLETILKTEAKSSHRSEDPREYQDLIKGRFEINVIRIERTSNIDNDIWKINYLTIYRYNKAD